MLVEKETLKRLYINEQLSEKKISLILNIASGSVHRYLKKYCIPTRDCGCGARGKTAHNKGISRPELQGENSHSWKGGRSIDKKGYVHLWARNHPNKDRKNQVSEHRLVMEKHLGRYLTKLEVIHHNNEIKDDNEIENLRLFKNQNEHITFHNKINKERNDG